MRHLPQGRYAVRVELLCSNARDDTCNRSRRDSRIVPVWRTLVLEQTEGLGTGDGLSPATDRKLAEDVVDVCFDCTDTDVQALRNRGVRQACSHQPQYLELSSGETFAAGHRCVAHGANKSRGARFGNR